MSRNGKWAAIVALSFGFAGSPAMAQAPPGPLAPTQPVDSRPAVERAQPQAQKPPVQPRTSIFGAWRLNPDDSDDPRKRVQQARPFGRGSLRPGAFERGASRRDGAIDVGLTGHGRTAERLAGRRLDELANLARLGLPQLAVDVQAVLTSGRDRHGWTIPPG